MHAMHYAITLPADYDMGVIHDRVATKGHLFDDFGRPVVQQWTGLGFVNGTEAAATPRAASLRTEHIPSDADPITVIDRTLRSPAQDGVHSTTVAIDTRRWELITFTLWTERAPADSGTRFRVPHLSRPGLN